MDKKLCKKFAQYLRDDGVFLIRMIQKNSNSILVTDMVARLWEIYLEKPMVKKLIMTSQGEDNGHNITPRSSALPVPFTRPNYIWKLELLYIMFAI